MCIFFSHLHNGYFGNEMAAESGNWLHLRRRDEPGKCKNNSARLQTVAQIAGLRPDQPQAGPIFSWKKFLEKILASSAGIFVL